MELTRGTSLEKKKANIDYPGLGIFLTFPIALYLIFNSVALLTETGALGTPLASPAGHFSLLVATLLFAAISYLRRLTDLSLLIMTFWTGLFAFLSLLVTVFSWSNPTDLSITFGNIMILLSWNQLPLLFLLIVLATVSPRKAPRRKASRAAPPKRLFSTFQSFALTFSLGLVLFGILYLLAPRSSAPLITRHYFQLINLSFWQIGFLLLAGCLVFILACLTTRYPFTSHLSIWGSLVLPGLIVCPLYLTLSGVSITPNHPNLIAFSFTLPVVGALGISISALGAMQSVYGR
ncbi:hypothetical protein NXS08_04500 [Gleimia sp. 6138-11-ORH1]|uniref:hypothetical protein n=1 Tax=Gleimia sp. 6138-11-ORH1 TaxID=2973937 RepID=UPI0021679982|nr:hypothetical protein [Gleimia sp. 6138-11-ORH1]MCS4484739.1 hypothetical protein [Gleimia sp. 6138-11-ORH1]